MRRLSSTLVAVIALAFAPRVSLGEAPPEAPDLDAGGGALRTGVVMSTLGGAAAAWAAWKWSTNDSYVAWMEHLNPRSTPMHWTVVDAPAASVVLCSLGGLELMRGAARQRGLEREVPAAYWIGLAPALVALGAEVSALDANDFPTRAQEVTVAAGTAASAAWFLGFALWEVSHMGPPPAGARSSARSAEPWLVVPVVAHRGEGASVGVAMRRAF